MKSIFLRAKLRRNATLALALALCVSLAPFAFADDTPAETSPPQTAAADPAEDVAQPQLPATTSDAAQATTPDAAQASPEPSANDIAPFTGELALTVQFDDDGSGGISEYNNDMKTALEAALKGSGSPKNNITKIVLTGAATSITAQNWDYLMAQYKSNRGWDNLAGLDLSQMANLKTITTSINFRQPEVTKLKTAELPAGLTQIGDSAFAGCKSLALRELPANLTQIENHAFSGCKSLALRELPAGLTQIGDFAFSDCTSLALPELPANLTQIGEAAFARCTSLALRELPTGLTQIGKSTFENCTGLALRELPAGLTQIGKSTFSGCTSLALPELPANLTQIGDFAFNRCTSLALRELPANLTQIGEAAFDHCTSLALRELPANLTQIGDFAFDDCTSLALRELPANLTQIGDGAFSGCTSLTYILMRSATAPTITRNTFDSLNPRLLFYVPRSGTGYDTGNWAYLHTIKYSPTTSLTLDPAALELQLPASAKLTARLEPADALPLVLWESSDPSVATVGQDGTVTAHAPGTATITAASFQNKAMTDTCAVTVKARPVPAEASWLLTVENGTGGGYYEAEQSAPIVAGLTATPPVPNAKFLRWELISGTGTFADANSPSTRFTMAVGDSTIRAVFDMTTAQAPKQPAQPIPTPSPATGDSAGGLPAAALLLLAAGMAVAARRKRNNC